MKKYYAVNYNTLNVFDTKQDLIDFYKGCAMCSEGHEQHRYMQIVMEVLGYDKCHIGTDIEDEYDEMVNKVNVYKNNKWRNIKIEGTNYMSAIVNYEEGLYE